MPACMANGPVNNFLINSSSFYLRSIIYDKVAAYMDTGWGVDGLVEDAMMLMPHLMGGVIIIVVNQIQVG